MPVSQPVCRILFGLHEKLEKLDQLLELDIMAEVPDEAAMLAYLYGTQPENSMNTWNLLWPSKATDYLY